MGLESPNSSNTEKGKLGKVGRERERTDKNKTTRLIFILQLESKLPLPRNTLGQAPQAPACRTHQNSL